MNLNFLKLNKNKKKGLPPLKSLRPKAFDVSRFWFMALGLFFAIFAITCFIGLKLFYSQYSDNYKGSMPASSFENIIDVAKLKSAIQKRNDFINLEISLPKDPSL